MKTDESHYDRLREDIVRELGKTCRKKVCGDDAFTIYHSHPEWVEEYAEWLVKLAVLHDVFVPGGYDPHRTAIAWMKEWPAERMETARGTARAA